MERHIYGIAVEVPLPYMREQAVTGIGAKAVNPQDKGGTEQIGCDKMDIADIIQRHTGKCRL